ncbi:ArsA-related P-loop ATPase, partial [Sedimentibacter sp.]|uniref:ArsA-related P-loop ATPase n=1 Tax=Sedimentibacter sp. TaxID=1960295 RepID=UPI0028A699D5
TQSYNKEISRSQGDIPESAKKLLPRLKNTDETEVIIVTLPEATPVYEALRLEEDLKRADICTNWWVVNSSLYKVNTINKLLSAKASNEIEWINRVLEHSKGRLAVVGWSSDEIKGEKLNDLVK